MEQRTSDDNKKVGRYEGEFRHGETKERVPRCICGVREDFTD